MKYELTNKELRAAIEQTVDQLQPRPLMPPLPASTRTMLENHLQKLLEIEAERASTAVTDV